ncbi:MAG: hypothetical protein NT027_03150 [Proteobacteria bacterium]|nr:hypothetical protein [Pseudomonadota bacterium]
MLLNIVEFQLSSSVVQAIKDIRSVRNYCSHLPTETISQDKFHELLTKLETGVKQLPEEHEIDFQQILSKSLIKYSGPILPEGGSRFDSHVLAFLSKAIATNQYPKHLAVLVTVTMPSDYDIMFGGAAIFPKVESKPDMLMEEDVLPHHYQSILDLLKLVSSMKENDTTTQRVVILNSCYTTWSYFIFQRITSDGSTNNQIFNMVNSVPVDLFASQARVDTHMQSCIPEYSGTQRDYETIVNYLLSNEVRINPKAHELYREIDNCIAWVSQNRRKGRLINYLITVSGLGNQSRMGGEESMIIALVATGHRLRIKGSNVYSNSFRPNLMIL